MREGSDAQLVLRKCAPVRALLPTHSFLSAFKLPIVDGSAAGKPISGLLVLHKYKYAPAMLLPMRSSSVSGWCWGLQARSMALSSPRCKIPERFSATGVRGARGSSPAPPEPPEQARNENVKHVITLPAIF